jgi:exonuclease VII large subunit
VARAIYESRLPVISAVGHEPDVTISDFVADARASTPSNAAEIAVPDAMELRRWLQDSAARMSQAETARLRHMRTRLGQLAEKRVLKDQLAFVQDKRMLLLHLQQRLGDLASGMLARRRARFGALAAALDAMSPLKVLGRGYAMAQDASGRILRRGADVSPGDRVTVTLGEGGFRAVVDGGNASAKGGATSADAGNAVASTKGGATSADAGNAVAEASGAASDSPAPDAPPKKRRGRPPKAQVTATETASGGGATPEAVEEPPKRRRGRPRKNPAPESVDGG